MERTLRDQVARPRDSGSIGRSGQRRLSELSCLREQRLGERFDLGGGQVGGGDSQPPWTARKSPRVGMVLRKQPRDWTPGAHHVLARGPDTPKRQVTVGRDRQLFQIDLDDREVCCVGGVT